jgi:L-alanine-DL-glutamate epimerase-like enolase superfamily enzyme
MGTSDSHPNMLALETVSSSPVIIAAIDVVRTRRGLMVRSRSAEGATGIVFANEQLSHALSLLSNLVVPFFIGKDARDLESLVDGVYTAGRNYKYAGMPFWNCVGHIEVSLFDLLGKVAGKPVGELLGGVIRREAPVYLSSLIRATAPEEEAAKLCERVAATGATAVKIKIGGRMSGNADAAPGRTEALIPLARRILGPHVALYADANGSYDPAKAIEVGQMLEAQAYGLFEEPCPWEEFEATKQVADALDIAVAGGEQDSSLPKFAWLIRNRGVDVVQPDLLYNGGFIRCLRVARLAEQADMDITPYSPAAGPRAALKLHFASAVRNIGPFIEHPLDAASEDEDAWYWPRFDIRHGVIQVPAGNGLGVSYAPEVGIDI